MPARAFCRTIATHRAHLSLGRRVAIRTLVSYLITFAILRVITVIIQFNILPNGPFRFVRTKSGLHIHHLFLSVLGSAPADGDGFRGVARSRSPRPRSDRADAMMYSASVSLATCTIRAHSA
jgi:hypothetical protein